MVRTQNRSCLLLGSNGQVGRALTRLWPSSHPVVRHARSDDADYVWDMITPPPTIPQDVGTIVVLSGVTRGQVALNTDLALAAVDLAQRAGGLRVLIASSQAVYGRPAGPVSEDMTCDPDTAYGQAKLAMEQAVAGHPNVTCLRLGNVAGCDGLLGPALQREQIFLDRFLDGQSPRRAYIGPKVLGDVIRTLAGITRPLPAVLNVAQPGLVSMDAMLSAAGLCWTWQAAGPQALDELDMDCSRLAGLMPLPAADPADLVSQARAAGWGGAA